MYGLLLTLLVYTGGFFIPGDVSSPAQVRVSLVEDTGEGAPVAHGWKKLEAALDANKVAYERVQRIEEARAPLIVLGGAVDTHNELAALIATAHIAIPSPPESSVIRHTRLQGKDVLLLTGSDDRGAMYSLLEAAERIGWSADPAKPLSEIHDISESPRVPDRGVTLFTMQEAQFENRLHDEAYWVRYLDMLSADRFNRIQILFAYETDGYMCPAYPYFVDTKGFPQVRVAGLTPESQARNRDDLHRLIRLARERGIHVTLGLWCHYWRYTRTWQPIDHSKPVKGRVFGLPENDLLPYTRAAFGTFLREFSDIDSIQFLMNRENGVNTEDLEGFWKAICQTAKENAPNLQYEVRAKGVSDDLIAYGQSLGLKMRLNTKFWAEQVGLPYPPTHIQEVNQFERRHGYADMLKYPRPYDLHWTLWTSGTTRMLLWGDPEYARRFTASTLFEGTRGFEVDEPLATKMAGSPHDMQPFDLLQEPYRYYDYEFERYWHFFQVYGRMAYSPDTSPEEWEHEFRRRFGDAGPYVSQGLHRASQILPRITAYCLPPNRFPTTRGWAERQREEDLPKYAEAEPSDIEQFESLKDAAADIVNGTHSARITPDQTSEWFRQTSEGVLRLANQAEQHAGKAPNKELASTLVDLRILANLARYHAERIHAGLNYALFEQTHDVGALDQAILYEKRAIAGWSDVVYAAGDVYNMDLRMGLREFDMSGHWKDELVKLNVGLAALERQRKELQLNPKRVVGRYDLGTGPVLPGYERVSAEGTSTGFERAGSNVMVIRVPDGRYRVDVGITDPKKTHGPMWIESNGVEYTPPFVVTAGQTVHKVLETSAVDGSLNIVFDSSTSADWYASTITVTRVDPFITHVPVRHLLPGEDLQLHATVSGVDPISSVRVRYGNAQRGYVWKDMQSAGGSSYSVTIPAAAIFGDIAYTVEAIDQKQRVSLYRDGSGKSLLAVSTNSDTKPPSLDQKPVHSAPALKPLRITATVNDPSGVLWVRLRYRGVSQHQDFRTLEMLPTGVPNEYATTIPAEDVDPHFDLMYLFEVMDKVGNGKIYPDLEKQTPYVVVNVDHSSVMAEGAASTSQLDHREPHTTVPGVR